MGLTITGAVTGFEAFSTVLAFWLRFMTSFRGAKAD
jgi:hypothetical protein